MKPMPCASKWGGGRRLVQRVAVGTMAAVLTCATLPAQPVWAFVSPQPDAYHTIATPTLRDSLIDLLALQSSGGNVTLSLRLLDRTDWHTPMAGKSVAATLGAATQSTTTDAEGRASLTLPRAAGADTLTVTFAGDSGYHAAAVTRNLSGPTGDVVFLIDESGSMWGDISVVKDHLRDIAMRLNATADFRVGLIGFGQMSPHAGTTYDGQAHLHAAMSADLTTFYTGLDEMTNPRGVTELGMEATTLGMGDTMGLRPGAGVCAVMVTDEDADDGATRQAEAIAALQRRGATYLGVVAFNAPGNTKTQYGPDAGSLAAVTGGYVWDIQAWEQNPLAVSDAIVSRCSAAQPPDLHVTKSDGVEQIQAGDQVTYTITANNSATQTATGVVLTDTLPAHTTFVAADNGGTQSNGVVTWPTFDLAGGATAQRTVTVHFDTDLTGVTSVTNTATGHDDSRHGADPTPADNTATDTDTVMEPPPPPDLQLTKTDSVDQILPNQQITYTLTVRNPSPQAAHGVVVADTLPAHASFVAADNGGSAQQGVVTWPAFDLAGGAEMQRTVTVRFDDLQGVTQVINTATVHSDLPDPTPADNTATDTDTVGSVIGPDLSVTKTDNLSSIQPGQQATYTISITNNSDEVATGVVVTDTLPAHATFVAANPAATPVGGRLTWPAFDLAAKATVSRLVTVQFDTSLAGVDSVTNTVVVGDDGAHGVDPNPGNNTATDTDAVGGGEGQGYEGTPTSVNLGAFSDSGSGPYTVDVDWGDGAAHSTFQVAAPGPLGTYSHVYDDNGSYAVVAHVTANTRDVAAVHSAALVQNVPPQGVLSAPGVVDAGSAFGVTLTQVHDPSGADTTDGFYFAFDCGSGMSAFARGNTATCAGRDAGLYTVRGAVQDKDGGTSSYETQVRVRSQSVVYTPPPDQTAVEAVAKAIDLGSFQPMGANGPWAVDLDWGDGSAPETFQQNGGGSLSNRTHTYPDNAVYTVRVRITNADGPHTDGTFHVTVSNQVPTATLTAPAHVAEGSSAPVRLQSAGDPSQVDVNQGLHFAFACDGGALDAFHYSNSSTAGGTFCHWPDGPSTHTVRARVFDKDDGFSEYTLPVTVDNVPPLVAALTVPTQPVPPRTEVAVRTTFTDPGVLDTHTAVVDWGDGTTSPGTVTETAGNGGVHGTHTYPHEGHYPVTVTVTDKDGGVGSSTATIDVVEVEHRAYIAGYPDLTFKAERSVSRAEVAAILARLLELEPIRVTAAPYPDVALVHWASSAITLVTRHGLMQGYPDGTFRPEAAISRAEIAVAIDHLRGLGPKDGVGFPDTATHWAHGWITAAADAGLLVGYPDGTFRPDQAMTRAEFVTNMNRLFGRGPLVDRPQARWPDVASDYWAYGQIEDASVSHWFIRIGSVEHWQGDSGTPIWDVNLP